MVTRKKPVTFRKAKAKAAKKAVAKRARKAVAVAKSPTKAQAAAIVRMAAIKDQQAMCVLDLEALIKSLDPYFLKRLEPPQRLLCQALTDFRRGLDVKTTDGNLVHGKDYDGLLNLFSRDTYKSTIGMEFFPIWLCLYWLYDHRKPIRCPAILTFQAKLPKAVLHMKKIKRLMVSDEFCYMFGHIVPPHRDPDKWDTQEYLNLHKVDRGGAKENCIEVASIGASYTGWHVTDKLTDDAVTEENYSSVTEQEKIKAGISVTDNILDSEHGKSYYFGTPYSPMDANVALKNDEFGRMLTIETPCFDEPPDDFFEWAKMRPDDEFYARMGNACAKKYTLNFPVRLPLDKLAAKYRKQGSKFFASQQLLDVTDVGTNIFRKKWLDNVWVTREEALDRVKGRWALCLDSAWKRQETKGGGDDTAMWVVGYDKDASPYAIDLEVSNTMSESEGMEFMAEWLAKYPKIKRIVKEKKPGEASSFNRNWRNYCKSRGFRYIPVTEPKRTGTVVGKENRIRELAPLFEMGDIFIVESLSHLDEFIKQYSQFCDGYTGKDDILDALADSIHLEVRPATPMEDDTRDQWQTGYRHIPTVSDNMVRTAPHIGVGRRAGWASLKGRL